MGKSKYKKYRDEWAERFLVTRGIPGRHDSLTEIAGNYGVAKKTVRKQLREAGIHTARHLENFADKIISLYKNDAISQTRLGILFGVRQSTISRFLKKHDVRTEPRTQIYGRPSIEERFERKFEVVDKTNCWIWTAGTFSEGYGAFGLDGKTRFAHRVAIKIYREEDPGEMMVLHHCDTPPCVNPDHLYIGDAQDNSDDHVARGDPSRRNLFSALQIIQMRRMYWAKDITQSALARIYSINQSAIQPILTGKHYSDLPVWPPYTDEVPTGDEVLRALRAL